MKMGYHTLERNTDTFKVFFNSYRKHCVHRQRWSLKYALSGAWITFTNCKIEKYFVLNYVKTLLYVKKWWVHKKEIWGWGIKSHRSITRTAFKVGMVIFDVSTSLRWCFFRSIRLQEFVKRRLEAVVRLHHYFLAFCWSHILFEEADRRHIGVIS